MKRTLLTAVSFAAFLTLVACSDAPAPEAKKTEEPAKKKEEIPTGPLSAKTALGYMSKAARDWAPDYQIASVLPGDEPGDKGKYPIWTANFVSAARKEAITMTYSTVDKGPQLTRGVNGGGTIKWNGPTSEAVPFAASDIQADSDAAYETAAKRAAEWMAKNPGKGPETFSLGYATKYPAPVWFIVFGSKANGYAVVVSAATGNALTQK